MKSQKEMFFGRKMDPCDYDATLAKVLGENSCVVIKAYNGKKKDKEPKDKGPKQEEFVK